MFYSHEILTSRKYGVATIWLVATLGQKSALKKVSRKAILDVDVPKACESILAPEAPLALRLQSNLLYGVSRVYLQQCGYVLSDVQHVQNSIRTLMRVVRTAELDTEVSRARPDQFLLQDDPTFLPDFTLESLDLDLPSFGASLIRDSQRTASLLSPNFLESQGRSAEPGLILPSDITGDIGGFDISAHPQTRDRQLSSILLRGEGEGLLPEADFEIDAEGNLIEITPGTRCAAETTAQISSALRQPEISHGPDVAGAAATQAASDLPGDFMVIDLLLGDGYGLPRIEDELPAEGEQPDTTQVSATAVEGEVSGVAPLRHRRPRAGKVIPLDTAIELRNRDLTDWSSNYLTNMAQANITSLPTRANAQARKNAFEWVLGMGIAHTGRVAQHVPAPLSIFHGTQLYEMITGVPLYPTGEKRPADTTGDEITDSKRRARARTGDEDQVGRGAAVQLENEGMRMFSDEIEIPREAVEVPEDVSSAMPWNITASIRGSSVARVAPGTAASGTRRSRLISASPLAGLGRPSVLEPFDTGIGEGFTSDVGLPADLGGVGQDNFEMYGPAAEVDTQIAAQHSWQRDILDQESSNFRDFLENAITEKRDATEELDVDSISFEDLLPTSANSRVVAAQALLHTLHLATRNVITATQTAAYGPIALRLVP